VQEFHAEQEEAKNELRVEIDSFSDAVRALILDAANTSLRLFLEENGFSDQVEGVGDFLALSTFDKSVSKKKNAQQVRSARVTAQLICAHVTLRDVNGCCVQITFTERATMRSQCRRLARFIRLSDFHVIDCFLELALASSQAVLRSLAARGEESPDASVRRDASRPKACPPLCLPCRPPSNASLCLQKQEAPSTLASLARIAIEGASANAAPVAKPPVFVVDVTVDLSGWERRKGSRTASSADVSGEEEVRNYSSDSSDDDADFAADADADVDGALSGIRFKPEPEMLKQVRLCSGAHSHKRVHRRAHERACAWFVSAARCGPHL
jgi:hypothetical protein